MVSHSYRSHLETRVAGLHIPSLTPMAGLVTKPSAVPYVCFARHGEMAGARQFGDHQVANVTTEVEARTIGARIYAPALADGRHYDDSPFFGIKRIAQRYLQGLESFRGSAFVIWDSGTPTPPAANLPNAAGDDPHSKPRAQVSARLQKSFFLMEGGYFYDVCSGGPCAAE